MLGIDAHKRSHTVVAVDEVGRQLGSKTTTAATRSDHLDMIRWADRFGSERKWAVEDCRHLSRHLERDMLSAGEMLVRVPPKMMAHARDSARTYGKSDPIDALAVARAALREPNLSTAHLDDEARELRLLVDHREDLVAERTRHINRLRWHLHEIDPSWDPKERALTTVKHLNQTRQRLAGLTSVVARIATDLVDRIQALTETANEIEAELDQRTTVKAPALRQVYGVGTLSAAKLVAEVASVTRFHSRHAFARHNGTAPTPVWSGNSDRHRLSRAGNRQLNAAIHRVALTQARSHPEAKTYLQRRLDAGATRKEAVRSLKRRLSDVIYRAMLLDAGRTVVPDAT
ncbi:MAG: IS110 family transposase [Actinomycetales bacterium]